MFSCKVIKLLLLSFFFFSFHSLFLVFLLSPFSFLVLLLLPSHIFHLHSPLILSFFVCFSSFHDFCSSKIFLVLSLHFLFLLLLNQKPFSLFFLPSFYFFFTPSNLILPAFVFFFLIIFPFLLHGGFHPGLIFLQSQPLSLIILLFWSAIAAVSTFFCRFLFLNLNEFVGENFHFLVMKHCMTEFWYPFCFAEKFPNTILNNRFFYV